MLIDRGRFRRSLMDWRSVTRLREPVIGSMRREGWRDLPRPLPSHLYLRAAEKVSVGELLAAVSRGYYLLEPLGVGTFDFERDEFRLPVCGFVLRQCRAVAPLSKTWLEGSISSLLSNIRAVARDLTFHLWGSPVGSPSILVSGLGLRAME